MGRGGCTAAGRTAQSEAQGQSDSSGGCVRRAYGSLGRSPEWLLPTFLHRKVGHRRVGVLTKPCKRLRDAGRRDEMIALIFAVNPSVSLATDSLSLRLGHGAALICHRHIIHYRAATSLPLAQGSLWVCRQARRNLFSPITKKKQPFGCFFLVGPAGFGPAGCGSQSPVPYRLATAQSISQGIPEKGIPCAWGG